MPLSANILSLPDGISDIDFYLKRSFDSNVMRSLNSDDKAVYCKFPHFALWGQIIRDDNTVNYGMRIDSSRGKLDFKKFHVGSRLIREYINNQIIDSAAIAEKVSGQLSEKVQNTIAKRLLSNIDNLRLSELGKILLEKNY